MGPGPEQLSSTAPPRGQRRRDTQQPSRLLPPPASFSAPLTQTYADQKNHENKPVWAQQNPHSGLPPGLPTAAKRIELISVTRGRTQEGQKSKVPPVQLWVSVSSSLVNRSMGEVPSSEREHFSPSWKTSLSDNFPVCNMTTRGRCSHSCETACEAASSPHSGLPQAAATTAQPSA